MTYTPKNMVLINNDMYRTNNKSIALVYVNVKWFIVDVHCCHQ